MCHATMEHIGKKTKHQKKKNSKIKTEYVIQKNKKEPQIHIDCRAFEYQRF